MWDGIDNWIIETRGFSEECWNRRNKRRKTFLTPEDSGHANSSKWCPGDYPQWDVDDGNLRIMWNGYETRKQCKLRLMTDHRVMELATYLGDPNFGRLLLSIFVRFKRCHIHFLCLFSHTPFMSEYSLLNTFKFNSIETKNAKII